MADEPPLVRHYLEFCRYRNGADKQHCVDLSDAKWLYPTTILPIVGLIISKGPGFKYKRPKNPAVSRYLSVVTGQPPHNNASSFIPIIRAERLDDSYIEQIYKLIAHGHAISAMNALKYIIGELVANIDEHSKCNDSSFMAQNYKKMGFMEAAFFDNGITIPGSFREAGLYKDGMTDADCIRDAVGGISTKPEGGRGHGLPSTTKILKDMNSDILIVSGGGAAYLNGTDKYLNEDMLYNLDEFSSLDGTLISFQMHLPIHHIDIYEGGYL